jgi:hypothetical protein
MRAVVLLLITALAGAGAWPADYIDTTFGDSGVVTFAGQASAGPLVQMADGSLVVLVEAPNLYGINSIIKLDRSGSVDRSFGNAGVLMYRGGRAPPSLGNSGVLDFGYTGSTVGPPDSSCYHDSVVGYHPTSDGGAIAVVYRVEEDCFGYPRMFTTYLVRIQPSGALDDAYGRTSLGFGSWSWVPGTYGSRLLADGALEVWTTFGKGRVAADGRSAAFTFAASTTGFPRRAFSQSDGSWILQAEGTPPPPFEVRRFDGQPDALFGNAGRPIEPGAAGSYLLQAFRTPDGGVAGVLSGNALEPQRLCVWRANGRIESCVSLLDWRDSLLDRGILAPDGALYLSWKGPGSRPPRVARFNVSAPNVEYFNSQLRHYFVTYDGTEARFIDEGGAGAGWSRTGQGFKTGGTTPVCRFYGTPGIGSNSHFFTISAQECELVKKDPGWTFEGYGFYATPTVNGQCEAPLVPLHRLYNNRAAQRDSNHRHVTDLSLIPPMVLAGWSYEGVAFCVRP